MMIKDTGDNDLSSIGGRTGTGIGTVTSTNFRQWTGHGLKDPRIVRVSRAFGGKDRHSKVRTVRGLRDQRVRLSVPTAIQLYDLQDRLGLNQPSKVVDWLLNAAQHEIDKLPPLQFPISDGYNFLAGDNLSSHRSLSLFSNKEQHFDDNLAKANDHVEPNSSLMMNNYLVSNSNSTQLVGTHDEIDHANPSMLSLAAAAGGSQLAMFYPTVTVLSQLHLHGAAANANSTGSGFDAKQLAAAGYSLGVGCYDDMQNLTLSSNFRNFHHAPQ